jgi:hypothetical protein
MVNERKRANDGQRTTANGQRFRVQSSEFRGSGLRVQEIMVNK